MEFTSRRGVLVYGQGCVACTQPYASLIGLDVLKAGGNAADAAVAVAAALGVTEPGSTGLGGDAFCLFYDAKTKQVKGLNGSGRCSSRATLSRLAEDGFSEACMFPPHHGHTVTVPGTAAAWVDTVEHFGSGKVSLQEILRPSIELAETGFPVQYSSAVKWKDGEAVLADGPNGQDMLLNGRAPRHGEIMTMPLLANAMKELASHGKEAFYQGRIARAISEAVQQYGGLLTSEDLANHRTTVEEPICVDYRGRRVWQMRPNGQGLVTLMALNILEGFDLQNMAPGSSEYLHLVAEALRLAFADAHWYITDPAHGAVPIDGLLSKEYAATRRRLIDPDRARDQVERGVVPSGGSDTVYFCVADQEGNACSFINSILMNFGSAIVPQGCGFALQNRGFMFSLDPQHPNVMAPGKRPYHTIIPSMLTCPRTGDLLSAFGTMGGFMQPQGQVQVLLNQVEFGMDPQQALDQPRIRIGGNGKFETGSKPLAIEEGISPEVTQRLQKMGHNVTGVVSGFERSSFGCGQVITRGAWWDKSESSAVCKESNVYWAGTDPRADGIVAGY
ncbi:hypothetical protein ACOMHN_014758 [Nucella lapillus]